MTAIDFGWIIGGALSLLLIWRILRSAFLAWIIVIALAVFTRPYWLPRWEAFQQSEWYENSGIPVFVARGKQALKIGDTGVSSLPEDMAQEE